MFCYMKQALICNEFLLYCRQKMNVSRAAFVLNSQHERIVSEDRGIVRLLFICFAQIVIILHVYLSILIKSERWCLLIICE
jgi:hypothetical protein